MRRFFSLVVLLLFAIPFGVSISGCSHNVAPTFCNGGDSGVTTGTTTTITLLPKVFGISLNFAEIGQITTPTATDCKGANASVAAYLYGTTDMTIADIQPGTGRLCAGTWNRNTGGGIPDFTVCNPTNKSGTAYITASADGVTSNPLPVFVHPVVTSIVLGNPTTNCTTDPTTNCCPLATGDVVTAPPYAANSCLSQNGTAQLVARIFAGTGANQTNISCLTGHLQYSVQGSTSTTQVSSIVNIDQNGVATAGQPGSVLISANVANAASSAGYFSTCPPASIQLTAAAATTNPVVLNLNNTQPLVATVLDTNNTTLTGLSLEYVSTTPSTINAGGGTVIPFFAGSASITAICQPGTCNPASYSQIGLFGNGKPITSNPVNFITPGTNSTVLYMASTQSQYIVPKDFTSNATGAPFLLPYYPNSMVISQDGSTIYLGSLSGLITLSAVNTLSVTRIDATSPGVMLAVSPDGSTLVLTDPLRQTVSLESSSGNLITTFGGVGTHAVFAPDSQTVYITTGTVTTPANGTTPAVIAPSDTVLVYSNFTGWSQVTNSVPALDATVTVPAVGAYFAGSTTTARGYCAISTPTTVAGVTSVANAFYPPADTAPVPTDRIAATFNGLHILGATAAPKATLNDLLVKIPSNNTTGAPVSVACPLTGGLTFSNVPSTTVLSPVTATAITGVIPTTDSALAFVTYTGSGGVLPVYTPSASGPGTMTYVPLSGTATAPIIGTESADNSQFYVGTSGDNLVHVINRSTLTDSSTLAPNLPSVTGGIAPVNLIAQKPRKTT
jgi:trimeric autotransporter adhesin